MTSETTRQRAAIFHGYGATPHDHWFAWLAAQLRADGIPTTIPALPDPLAPDPHRWERTVRETLGVPDEQSIIIAHSLGCLTTLRYLRSLPAPWCLGTLVLVSGFVDRLPGLPELDAFIGDGCDVTGLSGHIGHLTVIRSDDDPLVPPALTDQLAGLLGTSAQVVPGAGHFLAADGITALPSAYDAVMTTPRPPGSRG
ncbi:alpha/beta hydrolase [Aeromicrobium sp. YIM 150415]|uniref:RBBP9/YdeN family alpha/beta hydrolase n=1 Tax=Aeromicrobium sp. YIM 150415 TaxID=2803912 RepID=UPI001962B8A8|nr:alpha/beta hydrolase [Aeromicrobium sp. YIM 150415]MBM9464618.1 alpha/beta hydrolase [Aeromicrobium sp. YIM 150415]